MPIRRNLRFSPAGPVMLGFALLIVGSLAAPASPQGQPPAIVGIAHVAFVTSNAASARHFYHDILGFDEAFDVPDRAVRVACFKVNDHQYVDIYPGLRSPQEDRLVDIAFETTDARALRRFIAAAGFAPDALHRLPAGSLGFDITDPGLNFCSMFRIRSSNAISASTYRSGASQPASFTPE